MPKKSRVKGKYFCKSPRKIQTWPKTGLPLRNILPPPGTKDPIQKFLRRQAETFGLGYIPENHGGKSARETIDDLRQRTIDVMVELFGPYYPHYLSQVGIDRLTVKHLSGLSTNRHTPLCLRLSQAILLNHICGLRQALADIERTLWVLMQETHTPQLDEMRTPPVSRREMKYEIRKALGTLPKSGYVVPRRCKGYLMPFRAKGLVAYPELDPVSSYRKELDDAVARGDLDASWLETERDRNKTAQRKMGNPNGSGRLPKEYMLPKRLRGLNSEKNPDKNLLAEVVNESINTTYNDAPTTPTTPKSEKRP